MEVCDAWKRHDYYYRFPTPDDKSLQALNGDATESEYRLFFASLTKREPKDHWQRQVLFLKERNLYANWRNADEYDSDDLNAFKDGLEALGCPLRFTVLYADHYANLANGYAGIFEIDEAYKWAEYRFVDGHDYGNGRL